MVRPPRGGKVGLSINLRSSTERYLPVMLWIVNQSLLKKKIFTSSFGRHDVRQGNVNIFLTYSDISEVALALSFP